MGQTKLPPYAELHCISNFSFLRGASHPWELVKTAAHRGYSALALTDECSMAGIVRAHEAAKEAGLKLIVGAEFRIDSLHFVLLAPDAEAYGQICRLITKARRAAIKGEYRLERSDLLGGLDRCLALWIPCDFEVELDEGAKFIQSCFPGRSWIAIELLVRGNDNQLKTRMRALSAEMGMPITAAGGVYYHSRSRRHLHDVITSIRHRCRISEAGYKLEPNAMRRLRKIEALATLYDTEWMIESSRIGDRCTFNLDQLKYTYPRELVPAGLTAAQHLRNLTEAGALTRWPGGMPPHVRNQIEKELALVADLQYEPYFLTVADIVRFAKSQKILCQGRGSAANSAVCFALGITEVDPARSEMLFERFLSKERAEPPDIDIDFEHQRREEVIQYIYNRYGRERAALAATVISYRPKSALRDVGKVMGFEPDQIDQLAGSFYWFDDVADLEKHVSAQGFNLEEHRTRYMIDRVMELQGMPRHLSQHVGGFVISEHPLSTLVPIENAAMPDRTIIQWDKDDLEALGLLKVDCLALGMLSAIRRALAMVSTIRGTPFELRDIPAEDPKTYEMLCRGDSVGVFQVESRAQMSMLPRLKPKCFYDLVIEVAIIRPGPIQGGMVHPYLRRRQGKERVTYPSTALEKVLSRTMGVPLFQEQVMQIAMVAAGFSPGEADQVRRSMAAWQRKGGLEHFRDRLISGMAERGYTDEFARQIYEQILGFGSYGFPESHAASFALLVYASAWLKCHEPAAFCASLLNSQPMGFYAPAQLVADARRAGVEVRPVDVNESYWDCTLEGPTAMRLGLRMAAGMAQNEAQKLVNARETETTV